MLDDILKLKNILQGCEPEANFQKYEANILQSYQDNYSKKLSQIKYQKKYVIVKEKLQTFLDYENDLAYLDNLSKLSEKCSEIIKGSYDLSVFSLPNNLYKNGLLLLDSNENVLMIINILNTLNNVDLVYTDIKASNPFSLLYPGLNTRAELEYSMYLNECLNKENKVGIIRSKFKNYYITQAQLNQLVYNAEVYESELNLKWARKKAFRSLIFNTFLPSIFIIGLTFILESFTYGLFDVSKSNGFIKFIVFIVTVIVVSIIFLIIFLISETFDKIKQEDNRGAIMYLLCTVSTLVFYSFVNRSLSISYAYYLIPTIVILLLGFNVHGKRNFLSVSVLVSFVLSIFYNFISLFSFSLAYVISIYVIVGIEFLFFSSDEMAGI